MLTGGTNGNIAYVNYDIGPKQLQVTIQVMTTTTFEVGDTATKDL